MNETTTPPPPDSGPRVTRDSLRDISTLRRSRDNRMVGGVAEGLSRHLDIDPIIIRVLFAVLTFFGGAGLCLYLIAWATIPEEGNYNSGVSSILRRDPNRVMIAGLSIAGAVGAITFLTTIGWSSPNPWGVITIGVIALAGIALLSRRAERTSRAPWTPPPPWTGPGAGPSTPPPPVPPSVSEDGEAATTPIQPEETRAWWQRDEPPGPPAAPPPPPTAYQGPLPPPPMPPREPRSHLFGLTMAVIAIALGTVWLIDATVVEDMPASVYPGTALSITALALLLSTWYGRSRLLILVGIVASLATVVAAVLGPGPVGDRVYKPQSVAFMKSDYEHGTGRIVLDLSNISDPENLDGKQVNVDSRIGQLQVIVPNSIRVHIDATVEHGEIDGPPQRSVNQDGQGESVSVSSVGSEGAVDVYLDLDLKIGQILITQFDCGPTVTGYDLPTTSQRGGFNVAAACN